MAVCTADDGFQHVESLAVLVANHQCASIVAGSSTTCGTALSPLATLVARGKQRHGLGKVSLYLVEHLIILNIRIFTFCFRVGGIETVE